MRYSSCGGALARSSVCQLLLPINGTVAVRAVVSIAQQSRENTVGIGRFSIELERYHRDRRLTTFHKSSLDHGGTHNITFFVASHFDR